MLGYNSHDNNRNDSEMPIHRPERTQGIECSVSDTQRMREGVGTLDHPFNSLRLQTGNQVSRSDSRKAELGSLTSPGGQSQIGQKAFPIHCTSPPLLILGPCIEEHRRGCSKNRVLGISGMRAGATGHNLKGSDLSTEYIPQCLFRCWSPHSLPFTREKNLDCVWSP